MGVVGSVSAVTETKLNEFISKPSGNMKYGDGELYLDKSFWDINYVLTQYFPDEKKSINQNLIYGVQRIKDMNNGDEGHYAFSGINETKQLSEIINQYSKEEFEKYLDKAMVDPRSIINSYLGDEMFKKATLMFFERLKLLYNKAANNNLTMIYVYG